MALRFFCLQGPRTFVRALSRVCCPFFKFFSSNAALAQKASAVKKTPLYDFHVAHEAKMVDFCGWYMPVVYSDQSIGQSHLHTRQHASIFDVSHMLQTRISGADRTAFVESLTVADIDGLQEGMAALTVFTNDAGGIKDDLIVTKDDDHLFIVSNAGCIEKDKEHLKHACDEWRKRGRDVVVEHPPNRAVLAIQGPEAVKVVQEGVRYDLRCLFFMSSVVTKVFGIPNCRISRCGYTGEDGVEISVDSSNAVSLCEQLLNNSAKTSVKMAGLGARDSLRLEAGLCLYGNDMDDTTTPVEAGLAWLIAKARRQRGDFPGADVILNQLKGNVSKRRVGLISKQGRPPRAGYSIVNSSGENVGKITSGCPSPVLKYNISFGYVPSQLATVGTKLRVDCTGKGVQLVDVEVTKTPFVPHHYYLRKKAER
ncbi:Aminomethyltransferase [Trichuris trichiura]|uniref:Aminomethyltransferase n=1 Tax=Trichuris trichiura TaxID=36087 RepID=A0A077Z021_TRITR|nr:Aminomethyltransferase [Trichuris trichiura]